MGLLDPVRSLLDTAPKFDAVAVDHEVLEVLREGIAYSERGGLLFSVRPSRENEGMGASIELYETLHAIEKGFRGFGNDSPSFAHEVWFDDGAIEFYLRPERTSDERVIRNQVRNGYPNADIVTADKRFLTVSEGEYIAGATLHLGRPFYFPFKAPLGPQKFEVDPYGAVTSAMIVEDDRTPNGRRLNAEDCRVLIQTSFTPAKPLWSMGRETVDGFWESVDAKLCGVNVREIAEQQRSEKVVGNLLSGYDTRSATKAERHEADIIEEQHGKKGFYVDLRVVVTSPYKLVVERRLKEIIETYGRYDSNVTEQNLLGHPVDPEVFSDFLFQVAGRQQEVSLSHRRSGDKFVATVEELAALAHLPNEEISTPLVKWATGETGPGVPTGAENTTATRNRSQKEATNSEETGTELFESVPEWADN